MSNPRAVFRPISEYPFDRLSEARCYWGPQVLVRIPHENRTRGYRYFVAQREGHDWFSRDASEPGHFVKLPGKPDGWTPIPELFLIPVDLKPTHKMLVSEADDTVEAWRPMSEYPTMCHPHVESYSGPRILVRVLPNSEWPHETTYFVAWLDSDDWMAQDPNEPAAWGMLPGEPDAWMAIPGESVAT